MRPTIPMPATSASRWSSTGSASATRAKASIPRWRQRYTASLKHSVKQGGGSGLGLFLTQRICERFGWRLHLESTIAEGTLAMIDFNP